MIKPQRKNLKKLAKLIIFSLMKREKLTTINLVTQLLRELAVEDKVLEDSIHLLSQIFLKTSLVTLVEVVPLGDQAIEGMTLDTM